MNDKMIGAALDNGVIGFNNTEGSNLAMISTVSRMLFKNLLIMYSMMTGQEPL